MPRRPQILIIIVHYRCTELCIDCLNSVMREISCTDCDAKVIVIDNNSGEQAVHQLEAAIRLRNWDGYVQVVDTKQNHGFAWGNNEALRISQEQSFTPDFVLLLNPDTILLPNALAALLGFMKENPRAGIAGSRLEWPDGTSQAAARRFPSILSEFESGARLGLISKALRKHRVAIEENDRPIQSDWVVGASFMIRWELLKQIGFLDEDYFLYFEEVDFCLRARRASWECWYVPDSRVIHLVGQSTKVTSREDKPKRRPHYWFESRRRYFIKNYGRLYALLADVAWISAFCLWRLRLLLRRRPDPDPPCLLHDFVVHSALFNGCPGARACNKGNFPNAY
ncbi:MAG: glycosyltransferase family 2 protein [Phycisphaerae bacterium]